MNLIYYKGEAIQVKDGKYRLINDPFQWFPTYEAIINYIDKLTEPSNDKS
jgi:hypothetical protein